MREARSDASVPARRRGELLRIIPKCRRRTDAAKAHLVLVVFRRVHFRAKAQQLARHTGKQVLRKGQFKAHHRLQQHALRMHERIADRTVGRLAEISTLGMLEM